MGLCPEICVMTANTGQRVELPGSVEAPQQSVDSEYRLFESPWWRDQMMSYDATKCAESAKNYCEAKKAAREAQGNLERAPLVNEEAFLSEIAKAYDSSSSPRPVPEDLVRRHAEALNARAKAEDDDSKAKAALINAKKNFDKEMSILRSKV
jgi:hypothetical protein